MSQTRRTSASFLFHSMGNAGPKTELKEIVHCILNSVFVVNDVTCNVPHKKLNFKKLVIAF